MIYPHKAELEELVLSGLVSKRKHPEHDLWVYNYTPKATSVPWHEWSECLCDARGLILDGDGAIVGRGFRKFWNYEQVKDRIPWDEWFVIGRKYDGSLIITCLYKDELIIATRGSFESEQAIWAQEYTKKNRYWCSPGQSWLYEAIYPENKIVVDYGDGEFLAQLACLDNETGLDVDRERPAPEELITPEGFEKLKAQNIPNNEGYVIVFYPSCFRVKVKFDTYVRLHRIRFQTTKHSIWQLLQTDRSLAPLVDLLEGIPDDVANKIREYAYELSDRFVDTKLQCSILHEKIQQMQANETPERTIAEWIKTHGDFAPTLFAMWRGKDVEKSIWKGLEPLKERIV